MVRGEPRRYLDGQLISNYIGDFMYKIFISLLFILLCTVISLAQGSLPGVDIKDQLSSKRTGETSKLLRLELEIDHLDSDRSRIKIFAGHGKDRADLPLDKNLMTIPFEVYKDQLIFDGTLGELQTKITLLDGEDKAKEFKANFLDLLANTKNSKGLIFEFNKLVNLLISKNALIIQKD